MQLTTVRIGARLVGVLTLLVGLAGSAADGRQAPVQDDGPGATPVIAFSQGGRLDGGHDLVVMNADGSQQTVLVTGGRNMTPSWSPDGEWIAFARSGTPTPGIYMVRRDGTELCRVVPTSGFHAVGAPTWSPVRQRNGEYWIAYVDQGVREKQQDLFATIARCGTTERRQLTSTAEVSEGYPAWSRDGRIAMPVQPASKSDVHVFDVVSDASGPIRLVHRANLTSTGPLADSAVWGPAWTRDGTELVVAAGAPAGPTGMTIGFPADLWIISASTPGVGTQLTHTPKVLELRATLAPDDTKIAFGANGMLMIADITRPWTLAQPSVVLKGSSPGFPSWRPVP